MESQVKARAFGSLSELIEHFKNFIEIFKNTEYDADEVMNYDEYTTSNMDNESVVSDIEKIRKAEKDLNRIKEERFKKYNQMPKKEIAKQNNKDSKEKKVAFKKERED